MDVPSDLDRCSIQNWYPALRRVTIKTTLIPLSADFVRYLLADGVYVPDVPAAKTDNDWLNEAHSDSDSDSTDVPCFPAVEESIVAAIRKYDGGCFPKLNWSAPTDAAWVLGGSCRCASPRDVFLLLKSSDRIAHDLHDARRAYGDLDADVSPTPIVAYPWVLALRRWSNLKPSGEFRCFCIQHGVKMVAACQRDRFSYYPFLPPVRARLLGHLQAFVLEHMAGEGLSLPRRVAVDLYVDGDERVHLLDVAPFHDATDPLLFDWDELEVAAAAAESIQPHVRLELRIWGKTSTHYSGTTVRAFVSTTKRISMKHDIVPELRLVESDCGVAPSPSILYGWPQDLQEAGGDVGSLLSAARSAATQGQPSKDRLEQIE